MLAGIENRKLGMHTSFRVTTTKIYGQSPLNRTLDGQRNAISGMLDDATYLEYVENCYETCAQFIEKIPSVIFCHLLLKKIPVSLLQRFLRVCPEMHVERVNLHFEFRSNG